LGYFESHDEERVMYNSTQFGNSNGSYNITNINTSLDRMSAIGAISLTIPGPKMIWHFSDLGMNNSLYTCYDGSVNEPDCKLDTKPQPQWTENWLGNSNRRQVYDDWSRIIELKINEDVFEGSYSISSGGLTPIIYIWDDNISIENLKNVVVLSNFDVISKNITPNFPFTGTWYDLMDPDGNTSIEVSSTTNQITLEPGEFKIYGNQVSGTLSSEIISSDDFKIFPNPAQSSFMINKEINQLEIIDITGKLVIEFKGEYQSNQIFDISYLDKGYYLVKIINNKGNTEIKKLVKY